MWPHQYGADTEACPVLRCKCFPICPQEPVAATTSVPF
jgi:hypothetical protein